MTERGVDFESVHYLETPPSASELKQVLRSAGIGPRDAVRKNEATYKKYVAGKDLSDSELIAVMVEHPELIQRPIVVRGNRAVLARPVERLRELDLE